MRTKLNFDHVIYICRLIITLFTSEQDSIIIRSNDQISQNMRNNNKFCLSYDFKDFESVERKKHFIFPNLSQIFHILATNIYDYS